MASSSDPAHTATIDSLETLTYDRPADLAHRVAGTLLCLIPAVIGRVTLSMRGAFSHVQVRRSGPVRERYPKFLYDLFGNKAVKMPDVDW